MANIPILAFGRYAEIVRAGHEAGLRAIRAWKIANPDAAIPLLNDGLWGNGGGARGHIGGGHVGGGHVGIVRTGRRGTGCGGQIHQNTHNKGQGDPELQDNVYRLPTRESKQIIDDADALRRAMPPARLRQSD